MNYNPLTDQERKEILNFLNISSVDELFHDIPKEFLLNDFNLPSGKSEYEVLDYFEQLASQIHPLKIFAGGGYYDHYIPAVVDSLASRAEFYTAYTPYQPEASQGTLQALFEYQTAICELTGMDVSNASLYEGGTALAEAVLMAMRLTNKKKVLIDKAYHPIHRKILQTYLSFLDAQIIEIEIKDYLIDTKDFEKKIDKQTACVVFQNPNFFGSVFDYTPLSQKAHENEALVIFSVYPISLGLLKTPAEMGSDIVIGEGQSLGNPLSFGGPYFGFMATKKQFVRQMPGRIVGETIDKNGNRCFVLTLQAREQHIKRHKATSNICSNQSLCALRSIIYLSLVGRKGLVELATQNYQKTLLAKEIFKKIKGIEFPNPQYFFNEIILRLPVKAEPVVLKMAEKGYLAGIPLSLYYPEKPNELLIAITEKRNKKEIEDFAHCLEEIIQ